MVEAFTSFKNDPDYNQTDLEVHNPKGCHNIAIAKTVTTLSQTHLDTGVKRVIRLTTSLFRIEQALSVAYEVEPADLGSYKGFDSVIDWEKTRTIF